MQRGLFFYERFLLVGDRRPWNVMLVARLPGAIEEPALRAALTGLQARHPMLCVRIVQQDGRPHFTTPDPVPPIELRIAPRSSDDDWFTAVESEIDRPFDSTLGPLLRLVWLRSETVSELVLVASHCICDGRSMLLLVREILAELCGNRRPSACEGRAPRHIVSVQELCHKDTRLTRRWRSLLSHAGAARWLVESWAGFRRPLPVPMLPSYVIRWDMDVSATDALRASCRHEDVTPYTALATAFLRAVRQVRPLQARNRLLCPIDIRPMLPLIEADMLFGYPDTVHLSLDPGLDDDFWHQVRRLRGDLTARKARLDPRRSILTSEHLHAIADWFIDLQLHGRARNDLMFSHLGEADTPTGVGPFAGGSILGFLSSMPWRGTPAIFSLRDQGRMRFFLVSREDVLPRADAGRIRDGALSLLGAEAGGRELEAAAATPRPEGRVATG
ncbi:condensation domain-containing protein [Lichenicola sp.]|uniref:condensation domain-containing protein n=1 Tax=Lichenicola sp. TaxID=2804529 RepID=UPI003B00A071